MEVNSGKFGFLDSYSGDTNSSWGLAKVCRWPEKTCHPSAPAQHSSLHSSEPAAVLGCEEKEQRKRWVCGWGKRCGAKLCLIAALHGLHHFHQRLSLTSLPGQHVLPWQMWGVWAHRRDDSHLKSHTHTSTNQHTPWGKLSSSQTNSYHWYLLVSYPVLHFNPTISAFLFHLAFSNFLFCKQEIMPLTSFSFSCRAAWEAQKRASHPTESPQSQLSRGTEWLLWDHGASSGCVRALEGLSQGRSTIFWRRDL